MKLIIFIGISIAVYVFIVKPLFLRAPKEQSPTNKILENIFTAYNNAQHQKQKPQAKNDDTEYTDYEEIK